MKPLALLALVSLALGSAFGSESAPAVSATPVAAIDARSTLAFDGGWRFLRDDPDRAARPDFADDSWDRVNLPHDWSIAGPFDPKNPTRGGGGFLPSGVAWYRKAFHLPPSAAGRRVFVEFDGVMQNSDVWINGIHLGHRPNGYVSFRYELTPHLRSGADATNVLAVRADTSQQPASRWYSGAGIYRHVRLVLTAPVHLEPWSTWVTTPASATTRSPQGAQTIRVRTRVLNQSPEAQSSIAVRVTLIDSAGRTVLHETAPATTLAAGEAVDVKRELSVSAPAPWDIEHPRLYRARVAVLAGEQLLDEETVTFGIRHAEFTSDRGFVLNGRPLKLYGVCLHHDGGAFGAAVPLAVWEDRLRTLRSLGVNAIRTAHNPPDPGFLELCDRMGFLVMDELFDCWTVAKNPYDYHLYFETWATTDVRDTVRRDRNHPSVVLYSAGNEIHDTEQPELARRILADLVRAFHAHDDTRPVTQALFRPTLRGDYVNGVADLLDVVGTNYRDHELLAAWRAKPTRKIVGTEQRHDRETWLALRDNPQHSGQFLWTGVDYLGEARRWPVIGHDSGLIDRTGHVKPLGRERQSWWSAQPMVAIARRIGRETLSPYDPGYEPIDTPFRRLPLLYQDWNPANAEPHDENVEVYSNAESVELFLNGQSLGAKPLNVDASPRVWQVPFAPGTLRAVASNAGREVARDELVTAGAPARVVLTTDRTHVSPDWEDVVRVTATIVDAAGVRVPAATDLVSFRVEGPGQVVAVDDGDNTSHESFQANARTAFQGRCVAYVRASAGKGTIVLHASATGLATGELRIAATPGR